MNYMNMIKNSRPILRRSYKSYCDCGGYAFVFNKQRLGGICLECIDILRKQTALTTINRIKLRYYKIKIIQQWFRRHRARMVLIELIDNFKNTRYVTDELKYYPNIGIEYFKAQQDWDQMV
jgi:hypothetical protein